MAKPVAMLSMVLYVSAADARNSGIAELRNDLRSAELESHEAQQALSSHEAERALDEYADCLLRERTARRHIAAFLRMVPGSVIYYQTGAKISTPECMMMNATMLVRNDDLQSVLFSASYRRQFGTTAPADLATITPLPVTSEFDERTPQLPSGWRTRRAIGDCAVRADPQAAHQFVIARPWTDAEAVVLPSIVAKLQQCLPSGTTVSLKHAGVRAMIGEAIYKLAMARAGTPGAGEKN